MAVDAEVLQKDLSLMCKWLQTTQNRPSSREAVKELSAQDVCLSRQTNVGAVVGRHSRVVLSVQRVVEVEVDVDVVESVIQHSKSSQTKVVVSRRRLSRLMKL